MMDGRMTDGRLTGLGEAIKNTPQRMNPRHDWSRPYNILCLCKDCNSQVYYDGKVYYSLCLLHLKELELGPFFPRNKEHTPDD